MTKAHNPVSQAAVDQFRAELKRLRLMADMSQSDLGKKTSTSGAQIGAIERGERRPARQFAEAADKALGASGSLHMLWPGARSSFPRWMAEFAELEIKAQAIYEFQVQALPGLMQTKNYMSALLDAAWPPLGAAEADRIRSGRLERQAVFKRDPPPMCVFIVEELALHREVGGADVMKEQFDHLLKLAKNPFVQIQCVSTARGAHSAMDGSFVILEMSEAESLVYAEVPGAGHVIVEAQTVANCQRKFGALRSQALPHEETVRSIEVRRGHLDD